MKLVEETLSNVREKTVAELVLAAQAGDREAFGELFERYRPAIVALAMRRVASIGLRLLQHSLKSSSGLCRFALDLTSEYLL